MASIKSFVDLNSSCFTPGVNVRQSALGGYGIFAAQGFSEGDIVLRVPSQKVLDIHAFLQMRTHLINHNSLTVAAQVFRAVLRLDIDISETIIIWCHLCALVILRNDDDVDLSCVQWLVSYLDILLTTEVVDVDDDVSESSDALVKELISTKADIRKLYEQLVELYSPASQKITFAEAFQLFQAVKSRVLEIPCEIESAEDIGTKACDNNLISKESDGNNEDFETNVSLVPMLDFANHDFHNNAVFDVDRKTKEVILRLTRSIASEEEITICYSPLTEDMSRRFMNLFFTSYGFLPKRGFFSWQLENFSEVLKSQEHLEQKDYLKIAQWLRVPLEVTFHVGKGGEVTIDLGDSTLPLLFIPGLEYNPNWPAYKDSIYSELQNKAEGTAAEFVEYLKEQEATGEPIFGLEKAYGVQFNGEPVDVDQIMDQTGSLSDEVIDVLELITMKVLVESLEATLEKKVPKPQSGMLQQYFQAKNHILTCFLKDPRTK